LFAADPVRALRAIDAARAAALISTRFAGFGR
jgi:hypothetical protein